MNGWGIAGIVTGALFLLSLTPVFVVLRSDGTAASTRAWLWLGFLRFRLTGRHLESPVKHAGKIRARLTEEKEGKAPALRQYIRGAEDIRELVYLLKRLMRRVLRVFRIGKLHLTVTVATDDAASTALWYGRAGMAAGILLPFLYRHLRVRNERIRIRPDFQSEKPSFSVWLRVTTTPAAMLFLGIYAVFAFLKFYLPRKTGQRAARSAE
ncbi:MAG: DUF2953 domain-containing protein [Oscillospiraceae bacterium]|nr:DUF2953 domain-containing protein [Oscillospiraceae bacterium]